LGLELLGECVMIRKSEKRRLVGRELSGVRNSVPDSCVTQSLRASTYFHPARYTVLDRRWNAVNVCERVMNLLTGSYV
jgi:hypothetical protein